MSLRRFVHALQICYIIAALSGLIYLWFHSYVIADISVTEVAVATDAPEPVDIPQSDSETQEDFSTEAVVEEAAVEESLPEEETFPVEENTQKQQYTYVASHSSGRLFIRSGPSLDYDIIGSIRPGSTGDVLESGDEWSLIQYKDIQGYVFNNYLTFIPVEE